MFPDSGAQRNRSIWLFVITTMVMLLTVDYQLFGQTFRILPLGNSITEGMDNTYPPESQRISYRKALFDLLSAGSYSFDFVGHDYSGYDLLSDADHGGIPGTRGQYVVRLLQEGYDQRNSVQITPDNQPYLDVWPADIILLHIGTNDITHGEGSGAADVTGILNEIDSWEAATGNHVVVFIARILQRTDNSTLNQTTIQFNNNVAAMVADRNDPSMIMVDIESGAGLNYTTEMQSDGIHPKQSAYDKMGQTWFNALDAYLGAIPGTPGDFSATGVTDNSLVLSWTDNSDNETAFEIERATDAAGPFILIQSTMANSTGYNDSGLSDNTTYHYRIRAINSAGPSLYSPIVSATTLPKPPASPGSLSVGNPTVSSLSLNWLDQSDNETGFEIERSLTSGREFDLIHITAADVTSYTDIGLDDGTRYFYRIRATNGLSHSGYSNEAGAETLLAHPDAPGNLAAGNATSSSLRLSWVDRSDNESGFQIERSLISGSGFLLIHTTGADETVFTDTGLDNETTYYYRVRAYNSAGESPWSNEAGGTTLSAPPEPPSDLVVESPTTYSLQLNWADNSGDETGFQVERSLSPGEGFQLVFTSGADIPFYVDIGLNDGTTYYYRVRAIRNGSYSAYSNEASGTTLLAPPEAPVNLSVGNPTPSTLELAWMDLSDNESGFQIERAMTSGEGFILVGTVSSDEVLYVDTGLEDETLYYYRVKAFNAAGGSQYSNIAMGTTLLGPPHAPDSLVAGGATSSSLHLTWADRSDSEAGFLIERSLTSASGFTPVHTTGPDETSYIDTDLRPDTEYYFRVLAVNGAGNSGYSNEASARTWPPLKELSSDSLLLVYPNPSDGKLILKIRNPARINGCAELIIADLDGRTVSVLGIDLTEGIPEQQIEVRFPTGYKNGLYTLILTQGDRNAVRRVLLLGR